ncbi:MAG TPA: AI-2E family transporter [Gaiellaceae bacterium]|jgi:predicted PurR-regulated permease PerM|nr:AI-2E family transporter [Gaiellaceae bacterium]
MAAPEVRVVVVRPRTVLQALGIVVLVGLALLLVYNAWRVLTWILIAGVLAAALNPAVEAFERRGLRRGWAASLVFGIALLGITAIGYLVIPPLVSQVTDFVNAVPDFIDDLTAGRGPLGFLQDRYQIVDRIRAAINERGVGGVLGLSQPALDIVRSVVTAVAGVVTIIFLTFFMLLEGPRTISMLLGLLPSEARPRFERVGRDIYRSISGYATGNLAISVVAGTLATIVLFAVGSDYAIALGLVVAVLDLVPLAGATIAAIIASTVVAIETDWMRTLIVIAFFIAYQQFENQLLQPLVYGRTVELSPLVVLCAVLIGAQLAGIFGALFAIPIAGSLLAVARELLDYRREVSEASEASKP